MMRFLFGVAVGALGYWAYQQGYFEQLPFQLPFGSPDQMGQDAGDADGQIVRPTPGEISGRPSEPIPS